MKSSEVMLQVERSRFTLLYSAHRYTVLNHVNNTFMREQLFQFVCIVAVMKGVLWKVTP